MRNLAIGVFDSYPQAEVVRSKLMIEDLRTPLGLDDSIVIEKTPDGKIKMHHLTHQTLSGAFLGAFVGAVLGLILLNPIFMLAGLFVGFFTGLIFGSSAHIGVDPDLAMSEAETLAPGTSAVCVLVRENAERVLEEFGGIEANLLETRLCTQTRYIRECAIVGRLALSGMH